MNDRVAYLVYKTVASAVVVLGYLFVVTYLVDPYSSNAMSVRDAILMGLIAGLMFDVYNLRYDKGKL